MKKCIVSVLLAALLLAACPFAEAAHITGTEAAETLAALGLFKGTGAGFAPEQTLTRTEALVMMLRLTGQESAALAYRGACPFKDGGWAKNYLAYAANAGLVTGKDPTHYGGSDPATVRDCLTLMLRALGYSESAGDFSWADSIRFSDRMDLTHGEYSADAVLLREDMALIAYTALTLKPKGSDLTLAEQLYLSGAVSAGALKATRLASAVHAGERTLSAAEVYESCSGAVFYIEAFEDAAALEEDSHSAHGSGFFVTGDGVGVLNYHELDGYAFARVTASDGRKYDVTGVLYYDVMQDIAVIRVSRTDTEGRTTRFFPCLDLGDSDAVGAGEPVYTVSNPLGLRDTVSDGLLSNRCRVVDDPAYPYIQFTAPISPGSSGGPLLDSRGIVIGIITAMFTSGQNLNLAVPVNCLSDISFTGTGAVLAKVKETEDGKKANATLSASKTELNLRYGEREEILITHTCPGSSVLRYELMGIDVAECTWGSFRTKHTVPLTVEAVGNGEAEIWVTFEDGYGNPDAKLVIRVTVTGAPEAALKTESGTTG